MKTKLRLKRQASGLKLREVANAIKVTPQTVQQMEIAGIKKKTTAEKYASALNCDWRELLD